MSSVERIGALLLEVGSRLGELPSLLLLRLSGVDRTLVFRGLGAVLGVACALGLLLAVRQVVRRLGPGGSRAARVAALAERGASPAEIARRTGLSRDAVGMLLQAGRGRSGRSNLPLAARFAASGRAGTSGRGRGGKRQVVGETEDTNGGAGGAAPAQRLLDALA